jgi:prepilin-type N-terminal cleavage/methylation domain-containing protein
LLKDIKRHHSGFTLIELLVVIAVIGILATIVLVSLNSARDKAYEARSKAEGKNIVTALELYASTYGDYPPDTDRDLPPGIEQYLGAGEWPKAPWPGSIYDWDNWNDPLTGEKIYQISVRFCPLGQPDQCQFPNRPWAANFDYYSSAYFCISGPCRAHISQPINHPGYCLNCQ